MGPKFTNKGQKDLHKQGSILPKMIRALTLWDDD